MNLHEMLHDEQQQSIKYFKKESYIYTVIEQTS